MSETLTVAPITERDLAGQLQQAYWDTQVTHVSLDTSVPGSIVYVNQLSPLEEKQAFFETVVDLNKRREIPQGLSLNEFYVAFQDDHPIDVITSGYFFLAKEQKKSRLNLINFIADTAEAGLVLGDTDDELFWFREPRADRFEEIVANLVSVAVEHPLAESTRKESRIEEWVVVDGKPRLRCYTTTMDEILFSAKISDQTLDFEVARFEANERNYNLLRSGRVQGKRQTFIEFSPSPEITDEAFERGYEGRDSIFFFDIDEKGREIVTQHWLMSPRSEYLGLFTTVGSQIDEEATDVDIMYKSDFFSAEEVSKIESFIDARVGNILAHQHEFDSYIKGELTPFLVNALREPLHSAAEKLIRGDDISFELKIMENELKYAQAKMTTYIFEQTGERIDGHILEKSEIANLDADWGARHRYVEENDLPLLACDMSSKLRSRPTFFMSMGEMVKAWTKGEDEFGPSTFACPNCGKILTRGEGEIRTECDSKDQGGCGGKIKKC